MRRLGFFVCTVAEQAGRLPAVLPSGIAEHGAPKNFPRVALKFSRAQPLTPTDAWRDKAMASPAWCAPGPAVRLPVPAAAMQARQDSAPRGRTSGWFVMRKPHGSDSKDRGTGEHHLSRHEHRPAVVARHVWLPRRCGALPAPMAKAALLALGLVVGWGGMSPSAQARALMLGGEPFAVHSGLSRTDAPWPTLSPLPVARSTTPGVDFLEGLNPWRVIGRLQAKADGSMVVPPLRASAGVKSAVTTEIRDESVPASSYGFEGSGANAILNRSKLQGALGANSALIEAHMDEVEWIGSRAGKGNPRSSNRVRLNFGGPVSLEVDRAAVDALIGEGSLVSVGGDRITMEAHLAANAASLAINHVASRPARALARGKDGEMHLLADGDMGTLGRGTTSARTAATVPASRLPLRAESLQGRLR